MGKGCFWGFQVGVTAGCSLSCKRRAQLSSAQTDSQGSSTLCTAVHRKTGLSLAALCSSPQWPQERMLYSNHPGQWSVQFEGQMQPDWRSEVKKGRNLP